MDERTLRVLEFPKIRERLVSRTVTALGREIAGALQPSPDPEVVVSAQEETSEAVALMAGGEVPLRGTADIRDLVRGAVVGSAPAASEFLAIKDTLDTMRRCRVFVLARRDRAPKLAEMAQVMRTFEAIEDAIRRTIADDGTIPDTAGPDLARLRREQRAVHARVRGKLEDVLRGPHARMLQDPLITTRSDRYVVPVRQEFKNQFPGVLHDQSASGATAFMEPLSVLPLGNRLRELEIEEREEIARLLHELAARVGAEGDDILWAYDAVGRIDFAVAKALLAEAMRAAAPHIRSDGALNFIRARHPLLAGAGGADPGQEVVPIDIALGEEFTTLVITGPNTGGKTVTLKTLGLLTLMAQAGLHIPADGGSIAAVFPQVFADIGDEQSIEQSLSTFSSHMTAIVGILGHLRPPALVLLDEIGAGTDPTEGVALARALIEHLHGLGVRTAVTTHYNELKALAYTHPGIQNASVEFDVQTLRPTYRLLLGVPGRSNALTVAARLGLDPQVIERATSLLGEEVMAIDRVLGDIEADRKAYEWEVAEAARLRTEADAVRGRAEQELARLRSERQKTLARVRQEGEALVARARREIEEIVASLKSKPGPQEVQEARSQLRRLAEELEQSAQVERPAMGEPLETVRPGQRVFVTPLNRPGTVLSAAGSGDEVEVEVGAMRVRLQLSALRAISDMAPERPPVSTPSIDPLPQTAVPLSVSVRGQRVEEAIPVVEKYLDDAYLAGLKTVTVIHGKGTGTLRKVVHELLATHPQVKTFRLGERGEGESGATIVELRNDRD